MSEFPPRKRLIQVAGSLIRRLPEQFGDLLAAPRFSDSREAIERLRDQRTLEKGAIAMAPEEAAWLAELLLERWVLVGDVQLDPGVAIVGPGEIWLCGKPVNTLYKIATQGVADGWTAKWSGDARPDDSGKQAVLKANPPEDDAPKEAGMTVRVMGRAEGQRCVLSTHRTVRIRRPVISLDESRKRLVVCDHTAEPAGGLQVQIDSQFYTTQHNGLLELPEPLKEGVEVMVEGAIVRLSFNFGE